jgi:hypothetical protein
LRDDSDIAVFSHGNMLDWVVGKKNPAIWGDAAGFSRNRINAAKLPVSTAGHPGGSYGKFHSFQGHLLVRRLLKDELPYKPFLQNRVTFDIVS